MMLLRLRERFRCWASFRMVLTRKGIDAMYKAYKKRRKKRRGASDDETEASADEGRADPGTAEADQTASTAEGTADDGEAEQSRRARRGREQDVAEISRRMYEEIRSSRDPRDHDFCGARALYLDPASPPPGQPPPETVRWLRPAEVCAEAGWPAPALFVDSSSSSDVVQGRLGDCWFLSALAVVALQPRLLARLFRRWDDPPASAGRCTLVFHHDGAWRPVTIDDRLPCDADGQLLYARSATPHEMWVPLVEKAFAKLHGGYEALVSGFADAAMRQLTGGAPQRRLATARTRPSRSGPSCGAGAARDHP
ncbi:hypothetical protein EMIHUDRAFT_458780 [Emiliania huxleyi CCMP1516]|uniref:Calpain catalytic domain-containing protein n=2 Tax=Emiliania huxleyi TaxID=2903 RepID=A0A0D3J6U7_EMIH1|nr:hypothetical protein EMIHUDRAFT_458780 [Emiliania huxleyi CCMP1516]EOD19232.1 hypothetical protein EMIHUDRAFT_458780 [Emiliania huxleyi CCMP1516]|eukprot:XP_005771661.1 hypothetical protein EMIHUDRAFT_458780 [Emiliania huxleyi CCMP1516]